MVKSVTSIAMSSYSHFCNPASIASSSLMESTMWTCTICSLTMAVADGPSHLATNDHIAHLWDFNARALASCSEGLTLLCTTPSEQSTSFVSVPLGFQGLEHVSAEKSTPWRIWSDPEFASSTIPSEVKPAHTTPSRLSSTGAALWICKVCDRMMHEGSKSDHLAGKAHAKKLMSESLVLPDHLHDTSTKPVMPIKKTWTCPSCKAVFAIHEKTYHRCSSSESKPSAIDGPLDKFFRLYPSFYYDPSAPPATSFGLLRNHLRQRYRWAHKSPDNDDLWRSYQAALTQEFNLWFGVEDDLDAWQSLCRAVRISPLPTTIVLCRSAVRGRHVNIIDLIEWGRGRRNHVQIFPTVKKLSDYSFESRKIFSKDMVDELEAGAVLKHLLRPLEAARHWDG